AYARLWPTHGPARIAQPLTRPGGPIPYLSASGAYAILKRQGLSSRWERLARAEIHGAATLGLLTGRTGGALGARPGGRRQRVEANQPGDVVCLDTFYIGNLKGVGKVWQFTAMRCGLFLRRRVADHRAVGPQCPPVPYARAAAALPPGRPS